jgi:hypothetical protein
MVDAGRLETMAELKRRRANMRRRLRQNPASVRFWRQDMPDSDERDCRYCGKRFLPESGRPCPIPGASPSVAAYQARAFCSVDCVDWSGYTTEDETRAGRMKLTALAPISDRDIFARDGWTCYLCGRPTPPELVGTKDGRAPSLDHVVPISRHGTHAPDNVRCACRRCNTEKGSRTLWEIAIMPLPPRMFPSEALFMMAEPPTLEQLVSMWRHSRFDGDDARETWNLPPHPLLAGVRAVLDPLCDAWIDGATARAREQRKAAVDEQRIRPT